MPSLNGTGRDRIMNVLAVGAHPDDLEILCAGTLTKYAKGEGLLSFRLEPWGVTMISIAKF